MFALEAGDVVKAARTLAPKDRYERLADWVLAAPDRPVWRLSGELSPSFPARSTAGQTGTGSQRLAGASRLETGGEITAPALDLVATAQAAGKLDQLAERVQSAEAEGETESPQFERGRLALLGLIQIARGDDAGALKTMAAIEKPLKKLDPDTPVYLRWPELVLASRAKDRPALRDPASHLRDMMLDLTKTRRRADGPYQSFSLLWEQTLYHEHAHAHLLALADSDKAEGRRVLGADFAAPALGTRDP